MAKSTLFNLSVMTDQEFILMAKIKSEECPDSSIEEIDLEIRAIDDMLALQKIQSVIGSMRRTKTGRIRKDSDYLSFLDKRLDVLIDDLNELKKSKNEKT